MSDLIKQAEMYKIFSDDESHLIGLLADELKAKQEVIDKLVEVVKHVARGNCHCQLNRKHVEDNFHLPSCMIGQAQALINSIGVNNG